jgi:hypothetical protein
MRLCLPIYLKLPHFTHLQYRLQIKKIIEIDESYPSAISYII